MLSSVIRNKYREQKIAEFVLRMHDCQKLNYVNMNVKNISFFLYEYHWSTLLLLIYCIIIFIIFHYITILNIISSVCMCVCVEPGKIA